MLDINMRGEYSEDVAIFEPKTDFQLSSEESALQTQLKALYASGQSENVERLFDDYLLALQTEEPEITFFQKMQKIIRIEPQSIPQTLEKEIIDSDKKMTYVYMRMFTIMAALKPYFRDDDIENEELLEIAVLSVIKRKQSTDFKAPLNTQVYNTVKENINQSFAARYGFPAEYISSAIIPFLEEINQNIQNPNNLNEIINTASKVTGVSEDVLQQYVGSLLKYKEIFQSTISAEQTAFDENLYYSTLREIHRALRRLSSREQEVIDLRFGFTTGEHLTREEAAYEMGVNIKFVLNVEERVLPKLRRNMRIKRLIEE